MSLDGTNYWQTSKTKTGIHFEIRFLSPLKHVYREIKIRGNRAKTEVWREHITKDLLNLASG